MSQLSSPSQGIASARKSAKTRDTAAEWLNARIERARKIGMFAEVGALTPDLAQLLLDKHNTHNRAYRPARVGFFVDVIGRGEWLLTSQGISLSLKGTLNNGQHRCGAVVETGETVPCLFTFGESEEAFRVIDTGAARTAGDMLKIEGEINANLLAGAARIVWHVDNGIPRHGAKMSHVQIREIVNDHPRLREASTAASRARAHLGKTSPSALTAAYYLILTRSQFAAKLPEFWEKLVTGTHLSAQRDPILILRNTCLSGTIVRSKGEPGIRAAAAIIIAWNLWARRKQTVSVVWKDGDDFPAVV